MANPSATIRADTSLCIPRVGKSRSNRPWQRWASSGMLVIGALGILSLIWWLYGLPTGPRWLAGVHVALRAATWFMMGAWLKGR
jgi:hypothetical protein